MFYKDFQTTKIMFICCIIKYYLRSQSSFSNVLLRVFYAYNHLFTHICGNNLIYTVFVAILNGFLILATATLFVEWYFRRKLLKINVKISVQI